MCGACLTVSRASPVLSHAKLKRISPFAVPLMLEIGKVPVNGQALDSILEEVAGEGLLAEAIGTAD
jgi:ATP-dependent helicase Lhr and Lhr-like helicase